MIPPRAWFFSTILASLCALAWGLAVQAANAMPPGPPGHGGGDADRRPPPPRPPRAADLQRDLGITETQAKAVVDLLAAHHGQMRQLEEGARDQRQALRTRTDSQLRLTLGEAGFQRFQAWREARRPPGGQEGRPGNGPHDGRRPPRGPARTQSGEG
jgi:hypothetical protein